MNFKKLSKNVIWLVKTIPAFMDRFDSMGQENPRAYERISEMYAVLQMLDKCILTTFNKSERVALNDQMKITKQLLTGLVDLDRNATSYEITVMIHAINKVSMMILTTLKPSSTATS